MTQMQIDRIEARLPELLSDIGATRVPDYFDDMLRQTGRTRQRPAWSLPERWLPVDTVARPVPFRAPALRPLLVLLLLGLLVAGGVLLYAGSQQTRLPAPFGPARNGAIVVSTTAGEISSYDTATGLTTELVTSGDTGVDPMFARDGSMFSFIRGGSLWLADANGSGERALVPGQVGWAEWSDSGDRIVFAGPATTTVLSVVDVETGKITTFDLGIEIEHPRWRPGHDQIVFSEPIRDAYRAYWVVNADGTNLQRIEGVADSAINDPTLSPDGSRLAYATWGDGERIHALDIDTGRETLASPVDGFSYQDVLFSPDGSKILTKRFPPFGSIQFAVVPADGRGKVIPIGPSLPMAMDAGGRSDRWEFAPDGTQVLVSYARGDSTWLLDVDGSSEQELPWSGRNGTTWQRLAP